jgi:hypothetical protein
LSDLPENDERPNGPSPDRLDDEIPRQGVFSAIPKRTISRVVLLLAALAGIVYLRQRTASIASCMSEVFLIPPPAQQTKGPSSGPSSIKARIVPPPKSLENTP